LNLSLRAKIDGTVPLSEDAKKLGFTKEYPTYIYRNYTIVKDGFLNVTRLPVSLSQKSFETLQQNGVIEQGEVWKKDRIIVLKLDAVPVINRAIAEGRTSAQDLLKKAVEEVKYEGEIKALKYLRDQLKQTTPMTQKSNLTDEQIEFLERHGIGKNGFNPPKTELDATDFYMAKEFEIKIKGLSSLPKVTDVTKLTGDDGKVTPKKLTPGQQLVYNGLKSYWDSGVTADSPKMQLHWLEGAIASTQSKLAKTRRYIQETKFAILLGKKWFDEFTSREENTLEVDGYNCSVSVREVKVDL
jgi:hypothetical protein